MSQKRLFWRYLECTDRFDPTRIIVGRVCTARRTTCTTATSRIAKRLIYPGTLVEVSGQVFNVRHLGSFLTAAAVDGCPRGESSRAA
jgi:hypothetical protein